METTNATTATTTLWALDPSHSSLKFSAKHMLISSVHGQFNDYTVTLRLNGKDLSAAEVNVSVKTDSITTGEANRDAHLKSDDFFNAENHPELTFKSTAFTKTGEDTYQVTGDLTIRGITRQETLDVDFLGFVNDPWGNERAGFEVRGSINRFDYDLKWNALLEAGGAVVGNKIKISGDIELIKQNAQ